MKPAFNQRTLAIVAVAGVFALSLLTAFARSGSRSRNEAAEASTLLGTPLPAVTLRSLDGKPVALSERIGSGTTLIVLLGSRDCFSCSSYRLELGILKSKLPGITPILIGSGSDEVVFQEYFRQDRLESVGLLDPERSLLAALGVGTEPLLLLVADGRILFVDHRSSSAAAQFPFGRLLPLLGGALLPTAAVTSTNGASGT